MLVGCAKSKLPHPAPARELCSPSFIFRTSMQYAQSLSDRVFVLSGKYGLLDQGRIVEPYDETIIGQPRAVQKKWAERVISQMRERPEFEHPGTVVILAGSTYYNDLLDFLRSRSTKIVLPLAGLGVGQRQALLKKLTEERNA